VLCFGALGEQLWQWYWHVFRMKIKVQLIILGLLFCHLASPALSGQLEDGLAALKRGDDATAVKIWEPLAQQGNVEAQYAVGSMYTRGRGVSQDFAQAAKWLRKSADQGHDIAQDELGLMYEFGRGVPKDDAEAMRWFQKAAGQNYAGGLYDLGRYYIRSAYNVDINTQYKNSEVDKFFQFAGVKGAKLYRLAADQGHALAQYKLMGLYLTGMGVPADPIQVYKWCSLAAGNSDATKFKISPACRDRLIKQLKPEQILQGQRLVMEWTEAHSKN
jgi:TPR repeat protein